ncbi:MAG TPA: glycoside hydrolase family 3 C-terminal domain-containing protein, partial [Spirochaetota bacterium]|nr:glycoside hydrolase family 3 C-terminal domain-containing protein [Spirochaetota bacterium]
LDQLLEKKKKLILILGGGSPLDISSYINKVDAVLCAWYPGEMGGKALAEILLGKTAPSGKLPVTFPAAVDDLPPFEDYNMNERTYRYSSKKPLFPFGFGLSYTSFSYSNLKLEKTELRAGEILNLSINIKNTGKMKAATVIQCYVRRVIEGLKLPRHELKGFKRIFLKPSQQKTVTISLQAEAFSVVNNQGERVILPGTAELFVGNGQPQYDMTQKVTLFIKGKKLLFSNFKEEP